jgi:hypothetical protein
VRPLGPERTSDIGAVQVFLSAKSPVDISSVLALADEEAHIGTVSSKQAERASELTFFCGTSHHVRVGGTGVDVVSSAFVRWCSAKATFWHDMDLCGIGVGRRSKWNDKLVNTKRSPASLFSRLLEAPSLQR